MSRRDVAVALDAMQDDTKRGQLADGDFSGLDLTHEEQGLVQQAASDYPEVLPFFTLIELQTNLPTIDKAETSASDPVTLLPAVQSASDAWNTAYSYAIGGGGSIS
ncbi:MAG TPA: hypothetical protein VEJ84_22765 [Acidimicrobiales bacterium]|nr:hypothetical protein [Acidimicrobiales bacterium]